MVLPSTPKSVLEGAVANGGQLSMAHRRDTNSLPPSVPVDRSAIKQ